MIAERENFAKFVSIQGHYNLIFREEEREMVLQIETCAFGGAVTAMRRPKIVIKSVVDDMDFRLRDAEFQ